MTRILPDLPRTKAHWTHRSSEIPDYLMVPMSDGSVVRYNPEIEQPGFVRAMENIRHMVVGYPKKETGDCCNSQPAEEQPKNTVVIVPQNRSKDNESII